MLRFKIKETILAKGVSKPNAWLVKYCYFGKMKAHNLLNNKQDSVRLKDLQKMCIMLDCTPNDLLWWEEKASTKLPNNHSLVTKMSPPISNPKWTDEIQLLRFDQIEKMRDFLKSVRNENPTQTDSSGVDVENLGNS